MHNFQIQFSLFQNLNNLTRENSEPCRIFRIGKERPAVDWFWPIYKISDDPDFNSNSEERECAVMNIRKKVKSDNIQLPDDIQYSDDISNSQGYLYANGVDAPEEINLDQMTESDLLSWFTKADLKSLICIYFSLSKLAEYMREVHFYCVWCGCVFESIDELNISCPGPSKQMHDQ